MTLNWQFSLPFPQANKSAPSKTQTRPVGVKIPTCKITLRETFLTSPEELYRVLTTQEVGIIFRPRGISHSRGLGSWASSLSLQRKCWWGEPCGFPHISRGRGKTLLFSPLIKVDLPSFFSSVLVLGHVSRNHWDSFLLEKWIDLEKWHHRFRKNYSSRSLAYTGTDWNLNLVIGQSVIFGNESWGT